MTRLSSEQVEALFADALARAPEQWATYLATATDDAEAKLEVLSLLLAHQWKGRFDCLAEQLRGGQQAAASVHLENFKDRVNDALGGRYRLERELGRGGMATVWLAQDLKHDRPVAIKVLRPELAAALGSERFLREITVTARLHHPHVLTLLDSGDAEGLLYYAMPYVAGESLRERLTREKQLPLEDALQITREVADALSYAHSHDVLHRDIKPENILLESGHATVADFGIARAITAAGTSRLTETGVAVGTPAYMSPEQGAGRQDIDARSDLYALGCVLYEMLAGHPPFTGTTAQEVLARHLLDAVPRLSAARSTVPPPIEAALVKVLAKTPADRFRTARQFVDALSDRAPAARPQLSALRHRSVRVGLGVALVGALIWVATLVETGRTGRRQSGPGQPDIVQLTFSGNARTPALSADGQRMAYGARECGADGNCTVNVVVQDVQGAGLATVARGLADVFDIQWTSDGRYLLVNGSLPGVEAFGPFAIPSLGGGRLRYLGCCRGVIVGNSDTVLVTEHPGSDTANWIRWVTIGDGVTHDSLLMGKEAGAVTITVDPLRDGRLMLTKTWASTQVLVTSVDRSGRVLDSFRLETRRLRVLQPSPEGMGILVGRVTETVAVPRDPRKPALVDIVRFSLAENGRIDLRPNNILQRIEMASGATLMLSTTHNGTLVYATGPTRYELWLLRRGSTGLISARHRLTSGTGFLDGKLSPDGTQVGILRSVVVRDHQLKQFSIMRSDSGPETPIGVPQEVLGWEWSPDGSRVFLALPQEPDRVLFRAVDLPAGTSHNVATIQQGQGESGSTFTFASLPKGGLVVSVLKAGPPYSQLHRIGMPGLRDSTIDIPADYLAIGSLAPSPDGRAVAILGPNRKIDSLLVSRVSLLDGLADRVAAFPAVESDEPPTWLANGDLIVSLKRSQTIEWYRMPGGRGSPVRLGVAPWGSAAYRWSTNGRRILAMVPNDVADVYAIRNFGDLLNR